MKFREILRLIPSSYSIKAWTTAFFVPIRALLNFAGLAALLPLLLLVLDNGGWQSNRLLNNIYTLLNFNSEFSFIIFLCIGVIVILALKNLAILAISQYQNKFLLSLMKYYSGRLYSMYYSRGLHFIRNTGTTSMMHDINNLCSAFTTNVLGQLFNIAGELIFLLILFCTLMIYRSAATGWLLLCFIPIALIYIFLVRRPLKKLGVEENRQKRNQNRTIFETFKGYESIEINNAFPWMEQTFNKQLDSIARSKLISSRISLLPGVIGEMSVAIGLFVLLLASSQASSIGIMFGVFALSALRTLPSLRKILSGWTTFSNYRFCADTIAGITEDQPKPKPSQAIEFSQSLSTENISFSFSPESEAIIKDLSFTLLKGQILGIKGASGIGKTTLFNLLLGFYHPTSGQILIDGKPLTPQSRDSWLLNVGYVPQEVFIAQESLERNIALGYHQIDRQRVMEVIAQTHLESLTASLPNGIDSILTESGNRLSGGEKQRLGIARALYKKASILFLDEAGAFLDRETEDDILQMLSNMAHGQEKISIVIISHRESSLYLCDRIIELV